ncbi:damage-control phosphatase ARMT1-like isoform X4 [Nymphalis io]|uniref:damage-control phosphatase ARMT1-like isoform X3 n=1 Tax=Inachis io TaxID=171585 RepID=UPI00216819B3|nr:damage-control phosphatase ARMT1-like isoform X3 [Nymphalis io]XP_050358022.1 damage-control phosphatase ARMT1-like isoform X4 [Nymphalis io]
MSTTSKRPASQHSSVPSETVVKLSDDEEYSTKPEFIYGGPFIKVEKPCPFLNTATPMNVQLQGTFKKSFAFYSLKERLPIILTKVIDYLSRESSKIKSANSASDDDIRGYIQYITKLKNDLVTNKMYDPLTVDTPEARKWNEWISKAENQYYFTNIWVFSECYVYRRLREGCELSKGLQNFDPFDEQKEKSFTNSLELMCVVADKLMTMLSPSDKDKRKADFMTLLKICLWANKCDLSLSLGEQVTLNSADGNNTVKKIIDPFQIVNDLKDKLLVDDTAKISDLVVAKAEAMARTIEGCCEEAKPPEEGAESAEGEAQLVPCPGKLTVPKTVMFDIVCDNAGYELFGDLCLAHFLVSQNIVKKVRFHVKKIPWFVSDVTPRDFKYVIRSCAKANYSREIPVENKPEDEAEASEPEAPRSVTSNNLSNLGEIWTKLVEDGTFVVMCDDFWTSPHVYKDMKTYDPDLYRKLQFAVAVMFKGDLNYRKLLGERNCNPTLSFESALQGFTPAPLIAVRTVKADLICGLPRGKWEQLNGIDDKWMEKGDYGVIQLCAKSEVLKVSERPCVPDGEIEDV